MKYLGNFAVADKRMGNTVTWYLTPPKDINMRIPEQVRNCVVYLGKNYGVGNELDIQYRGTGFFVAKPSTKIPGASILFLVTAKHVADKLTNGRCFVRANRRDGTSNHLEIPQNSKWYFHPDDSAADIAIIPLGMDPNIFDFTPISTQSILTEQIRLERGVGIGDSIYITGLFVYHQGFAKNVPILRTGNIAMIPDERIFVTNFGDMEAYLIEAHSIGGLSGSPVFCIARRPVEKGEIEITMFLMGLMHGHYRENFETIIDETEPDTVEKKYVNVGIAIVTPATKILEIINTGDLAKVLDEYEAKEASKSSTTPDKI